MERKGRTNAFFIEIIIVILFFALSMAVVVQVFAAAHSRSVLSGDTDAALIKAQDAAEQFRALAQPGRPLAFLDETGDTAAVYFDGGWQITEAAAAAYTLRLAAKADDTGAGTLMSCAITVTRADGATLSELTASRYVPDTP